MRISLEGKIKENIITVNREDIEAFLTLAAQYFCQKSSKTTIDPINNLYFLDRIVSKW